MKIVVVYYSFTDKTRKLALKRAEELSADIVEVKEIKKRDKINAYAMGSLQAMKKDKVDIENIDYDFSLVDKIIIYMPIWAGVPAPAFNSLIALLPKGKEIELVMSSASGKTWKKRGEIIRQVEAIGCKVVKYSDVKTSK